LAQPDHGLGGSLTSGRAEGRASSASAVGIRLANASRGDELRGADIAAGAATLRELARRPRRRPFPDVPVVVLSAARGVPRRFRSYRTRLQEGLAASGAAV
jgi:hypothetical protein